VNKKLLIGLALLALVAVALVAFIEFASGREPIAIVKVEDVTGKPIADATITPDGLRPKQGGGHYAWTDRVGVKPLPVKTDARGLARVPYPTHVVEHLETGEISFRVDHPDFVSDRPFRVVAATLPRNARFKDKARFWFEIVTAVFSKKRISFKPDPVILQRGAILKISGYTEQQPIVKSIHPQVSSIWGSERDYWSEAGDGALMTRRLPSGSISVRLIHLSEPGRFWFSEATALQTVAGVTNEVRLQLRPGSRLQGKLDDSVPRPVTNGRVALTVFSDDGLGRTGFDRLAWRTSRKIASDGTFVFEWLPPGEVEMIGLCDGFVSQNGPVKRQTSVRTPQHFALGTNDAEVILLMEPAAECEVTVVDDKDQPLAGAAAMFWPNIIWAEAGTTIFAEHGWDSEELYRTGKAPEWRDTFKKHQRLFTADTDAKGIALVRNIPAYTQSFLVTHTNFEMPVYYAYGSAHRETNVDLVSGETTRVKVRMQKKGMQYLEHTR
jgi:hypothetical protein